MSKDKSIQSIMESQLEDYKRIVERSNLNEKTVQLSTDAHSKRISCAFAEWTVANAHSSQEAPDVFYKDIGEGYWIYIDRRPETTCSIYARTLRKIHSITWIKG